MSHINNCSTPKIKEIDKLEQDKPIKKTYYLLVDKKSGVPIKIEQSKSQLFLNNSLLIDLSNYKVQTYDLEAKQL